MTPPHYYNEFDPYAAEWLRNLIAARLIPAGDVDTRSITDVAADDLAGYRQCHFFGGIGGWALAARLAGWPESRELWTGSAPCQPFSVAGAQRGTADDRHLWPHFFRLIAARRPAAVMGEQVAAAVGKDWLDGVCADLEGIGYACGAAVVPACAVDAPHRRDRLWFVAHADDARLQGHAGHVAGAAAGRGIAHGPASTAGVRDDEGDVADSSGSGCAQRRAAVHASERDDASAGRIPSPWQSHAWIIGHDGKARRVEPSIRLLAHGVPARVGRLRAYGNAIVPQVAAEVIAAFMECAP
jgi:DNA (cytosine-5)-methyltransferase 1